VRDEPPGNLSSVGGQIRGELLGEERSRWFAEAFEPPCEQLLTRVDVTAGPNYQPASRLR